MEPNEDIEKVYKRAIDIKRAIATLEEELEATKKVITDDILANNGDTVSTNLGTFYISRTKKYQYSEAHQAMKKLVADAEDKIQALPEVIKLNEFIENTEQAAIALEAKEVTEGTATLISEKIICNIKLAKEQAA